MSIFASHKTIKPSSFRDHTYDSVGVSHDECLTPEGQMMGPDLGLVETSEVDHIHLQYLFTSQIETKVASPNARPPTPSVIVGNASGSTPISPLTTIQAMDLSASADCVVMPEEKTPISFGEVPGFVLDKVRGEGTLTEPPANSSTSLRRQSRSGARVCLETRFNNLSADTPNQNDMQSAVLSNFMTVIQQSAENQDTVLHLQMQKWMKDRAISYEVPSHFMGGVFSPVTNPVCEQVISHIPHVIDPRHQGLIRVAEKSHRTNGRNETEAQQSLSQETTPAASRKHSSTSNPQPMRRAKAALASAAGSGRRTKEKTRQLLSPGQRRENHNSKERDRRKRIRLHCDELNRLVPFCNSETDKVTTLQWTTAFLRYINNTYGDTFREEFKRKCREQKGLFLKASPSSEQVPMHGEMNDPLTIPLFVEQ